MHREEGSQGDEQGRPSLSLVREGISKCEMTETEMWEIPYRGACG